MDVQAPPVVAVLVACDPGPWFAETLEALASQDYPNLAVLVVDAASASDLTGQVRRFIPGATVRRLPTDLGFGASANVALGLVDQATHLVFCHDDAAPAPDALRQMVEEAYRSNAGVVAPKLVSWEEPDRLLQVGMGMDKGGVPAPRVEPGELDQEQHDAVRDVFVAPGGFCLVRADLFGMLGGFDPAIALFGEDVDLCWRAQVLGARVVVAPAARVRHRESLASGQRAHAGRPWWPAGYGDGGPSTDDPTRAAAHLALARRHELRSVLKAYSPWHLTRVLSRLAFLGALEVILALATASPNPTRAIVGAWRWNLQRAGELRRARGALQRRRAVPDRDIRRLQSPGSARLGALRASWLATDGPPVPRLRGLARLRRSQPHGDRAGDVGPASADPGRPPGAGDGSGPTVTVVGWAAVVVVMVVGSRHLLGSAFPRLGQLTAWPSWSTFLHDFATGWRPTGLGAQAPAPLSFALLGLGGAVFLGHMGLLHHLAVLGLLPVGALGAWRLGRPLGSRVARLVVMVVFAALPVAYDALGAGRWDVMVAYAGAPWMLGILLSCTGVAPFGAGRPGPAPSGPSDPFPGPRRPISRPRRVLALAVLVAVMGAFVPSEILVVVVVAAGIQLGSVLMGTARASMPVLAVAAGAAAGALVLLAPWTFGLLQSGSGLTALGDGGSAGPAGIGQLLSLRAAGAAPGPLGLGFVVAGALPLLVGRSWRLAWATRLWGVALTCWALAWLAGKGWLGVGGLPAGALVAPAGAALALCAGLGVVSFQRDLRGYRFGWRQGASLLAAIGATLGVLTAVAAALSGTWGLPAQGYDQILSWMPARSGQGSFRVLWLGQPDALPLGSWSLGRDLAYATSENGLPDATSLWPPADPGAARLLGQDVTLARRGLTTRLGHLLAPMAIRYIVVPTQLAPGPGAPSRPPPGDVSRVLGSQEDLLQLPGSPSLLVFSNVAWAPERALLSPSAAAASRAVGPSSALAAELAGSRPVLPGRAGASSYHGFVPAGTVAVSSTASSRWVLSGPGGVAPARPAFDFASSYQVDRSGTMTLAYHTSPGYLAAIAGQGLLWALAVFALIGSRRGGRPSSRTLPPGQPGAAVAVPADEAPLVPSR